MKYSNNFINIVYEYECGENRELNIILFLFFCSSILK